ncbi:Hypothetical predicted protein [Olea europaea subsp. europaea]|uniref:Uncharacterized protein n=1 Tax=Olea europaea subsp. europaea TaxID=158383 RepID=A0A8S0U809_OLEEU|nr:Hypothetical predicted protein [Olea europaea subsp. europaea]
MLSNCLYLLIANDTQRFFEEDKIICLIVTLPRVLHGILEVGVNTADFAAVFHASVSPPLKIPYLSIHQSFGWRFLIKYHCSIRSMLDISFLITIMLSRHYFMEVT